MSNKGQARAWRPVDLQWSVQTGGGQQAVNPPDLYLEWALLTGFEGMVPLADVAAEGETRWVEVLVELMDPLNATSMTSLPFDVPPLYASHASRNPDLVPRFLTARVTTDNLSALWRSPAIRRFEIGLAVQGQPTVSPGLMDALGAVPKRLNQSAIAVIDHGCPFLNQQFAGLDGRATRIRWLWDQGHASDGHGWNPDTVSGYGRALSKADIDKLLLARAAQASNQGWVEDELQLYARMDHLRRPPPFDHEVFERTHGVHVLDVAAGRRDTWAQDNDLAAIAPIVFVQLPDATVYDASGGSLGVRILDALHYILARTEGKLVVNISYGTYAGPHDGSSLLEAAIDELCELEERLQVVVAAGNSRQVRAHAQLQLTPGQCARLLARASPSDLTDSFIEFWYEATEHATLELQVTAPDGCRSGWCPADSHEVLYDTAGGEVGPAEVRAALMHRSRVAGGSLASMALLAMVNSRRGPSAAGDWLIELRCPDDGTGSVAVHAWIERDDLARGVPDEPLHFEPDSCMPPGVVSESCTLASIASGRRTVVVGSMDAGFQLARYSSAGPTRDGRDLPSVLGLGSDDTVLRGVLASATRSGDSFRMPGTSVAAAVITRTLFNAL